MGRFYSTNVPRSVDYAYKPPFELMMKAIANSDAQTDEIYNQADLLENEMLKVKFMEQDQGRVKAKQDYYKEKIGELTGAIAENPLEWRRAMPKLRNTSRELKQDLNAGEIARIQENRAAMDAFEAQSQKQMQSGLLGASDYNVAKANMLKGFQGTGYDANTGVYNKFTPETLMNTPQIMDKAIKLSNNIKASLKKTRFDEVKGQWIYTSLDGKKQVTEDQIGEAVQQGLTNDIELQNYFSQGQRLGYRPGGVDAQGGIIPAFTRGPNGEMVWNAKSPILGAVRSRIASEAFTEEETDRTREVNPYAMQANAFANQQALMRMRAANKTGPNGGPDMIDAFSHLQNTFANANVQKNVPVFGSPEFIAQQSGVGKNLGIPIETLDPSMKEVILGSIVKEQMEDFEQEVPNPNYDGTKNTSRTMKIKGKRMPPMYLELKPSKYEKHLSNIPVDDRGIPDKGRFEAGKIYRTNQGVVFKYNGANAPVDMLEDATFEIKGKNGELKGTVSRDVLNVEYNKKNKGVNKNIMGQESDEFETGY